MARPYKRDPHGGRKIFTDGCEPECEDCDITPTLMPAAGTEERPFVRLPQGGRKMYTDGKAPQFEDYGASDFALDAWFVIIIILILALIAITLNVIL